MFNTTLVNGQYSDSISVRDRGLAYGDGLFETIRVSKGEAEFLPEHLERLRKGCARLHIVCDLLQVRSDIAKLLAAHTDQIHSAVLKIVITREATGRSYQTDRYARSNRIISLVENRVSYLANQQQGVSVIVCDTRLAINPKIAGIKHLCRLENVLARAEWDNATIAEGLMLDTDGRLVEGTMSNIFLVREGRVLAPSVQRCGVDGVIRQHILYQVAPELGLGVSVCDLSLNHVYQADELFLSNSLIGVWPITSVGCHNKSIGCITRDIQRTLNCVPGV
jgi:4-amino-4-deoxychorismate lyase